MITEISKECILMFGMHRCGTSMLAAVYNDLGYSIGLNPMGGDAGNLKGHFENIEVYNLNQQILEDHYFTWDSVNIELDFSIEKYLDQAISVINDQFSGESKIVIKDPRISFTYKLWVAALKELDYRIFPIISIRHPEEVAQSLSKRNNFTFSKSLILYVSYLVSALSHSENNTNTTIIGYEDLLGLTDQVKKYFKDINVSEAELQGLKDRGVIDVSLRREICSDILYSIIPKGVLDFYHSLNDACGDGKRSINLTSCKALTTKMSAQYRNEQRSIIESDLGGESLEYIRTLRNRILDYRNEITKRNELHKSYAFAKEKELIEAKSRIDIIGAKISSNESIEENHIVIRKMINSSISNSEYLVSTITKLTEINEEQSRQINEVLKHLDAYRQEQDKREKLQEEYSRAKENQIELLLKDQREKAIELMGIKQERLTALLDLEESLEKARKRVNIPIINKIRDLF